MFRRNSTYRPNILSRRPGGGHRRKVGGSSVAGCLRVLWQGCQRGLNFEVENIAVGGNGYATVSEK
jgi:hypothetical protein